MSDEGTNGDVETVFTFWLLNSVFCVLLSWLLNIVSALFSLATFDFFLVRLRILSRKGCSFIFFHFFWLSSNFCAYISLLTIAFISRRAECAS